MIITTHKINNKVINKKLVKIYCDSADCPRCHYRKPIYKFYEGDVRMTTCSCCYGSTLPEYSHMPSDPRWDEYSEDWEKEK